MVEGSWVGLDVHARSVLAGVLDAGSGELRTLRVSAVSEQTVAWLETLPQNTPGTSLERPNWRRRAARTFESFSEDPRVLALLREIDRLRREAGDPASTSIARQP